MVSNTHHIIFFLGLLAGGSAQTVPAGGKALASTPPRGWNSYDSFTWVVNETEFLDNCQYMADNLLKFGYEYCVIDFLWYQQQDADDDLYDTWKVDEYGRPMPDPRRWPSSAGGKGFRPVADKVHQMGLKFGFHIMMGTSSDAQKAKAKVKGTSYSISDIMGSDQCPNSGPTKPYPSASCGCNWNAHSKDVNASHPGAQPYYASLYDLFVNDWQVDFIKNDCIFGSDYRPQLIELQSKLLQSATRDVVYSLSPGGTGADFPWVHDFNDFDFAQDIHPLVSMYRITNDDWDTWKDIVPAHFDAAKNASEGKLIGAEGLRGGKSWPDMDMLPLGYISTVGSNAGPDHFCRLSHDEQYTQLTLWSMVRSPLFFGGDMRRMDNFTLTLLTNKEVLGIVDDSSGNAQVSQSKTTRVWRALSSDGATVYAALFNVGADETTVSASFEALQVPNPGSASCGVRDVWTGEKMGTAKNKVAASVNKHGVALLALTC